MGKREKTAKGAAGAETTFYRRHRGLVRLGVALAVAAVVVAAVAVAVHVRQQQEIAAAGGVALPGELVPIEGSSGRTGAFTARIAYTSMAADEDAHVATDVAWDDDWFFEDPTVYNHELATTCAVLSAVANAESDYYHAHSTSPAYMEDALAALGFEEISTSSYRYRSMVVDEVVDLLARSDDVVAYSVATKHLVSSTGEEKTLYLVSIRGSYGSEWLSDLNMGHAEDYEMDEIDHQGFMFAAQEIIDDLSRRLGEDAGGDIALLFTGHSRGAAAANLAASYADDMTTGLRTLAPLDGIYCYTFATPEVTIFSNTDDPLYDNIFNILNPSDLVPRLPLEAWGFGRYGHDLWLPGYGDEVFEERYPAMQETFEENVGVACPYVPSDRERVDAFVADLAREVPTEADIETVRGVASLVRDLLADLDPMQVLYGHYPNVYIAWMQVIDAEGLRAGGADADS